MKFATFIDLGAFIWDEEMFNGDQRRYYPILDWLPKLLKIFVDLRIPIIFREEQFSEVKSNFPHGLIPNEYRDFRITVFSLLGNVNIVDYKSDSNDFTVDPDIFKEYFSDSTIEELGYILNFIYVNDFYSSRYLTFSTIWENENQIFLRNGNEKTIEVDLIDKVEDLFEFSKNLKKIFEHNPKHKKVKKFFKGRKISGLHCFNPRKPETSNYVQLLLDEAIEIDGWYYNVDKNKNFIRFLRTGKNIFHAFEDSPSEKIISKYNAKRNE